MTHPPALSLRTLVLTAVTMMFFAANSLLARLALRTGEIEAGIYTAVRLLSGAAALAMVMALRNGGLRQLRKNGSARAALWLYVYAIAFSFAYVSLPAGTGALVLFATVQITMLGAGIVRGERPPLSEWMGLILAFGGLVYLVSPGLAAPPPLGVALMAASGVTWALYSLAAAGVDSPVAATAGNFVRSSPLAAITLAAAAASGHGRASAAGLAMAVVSGALTSGLGYVIWYRVLSDLPTSRAAIVQLTIPVIAAAAGVALLGEPLTARLVLASACILGGVAAALAARKK